MRRTFINPIGIKSHINESAIKIVYDWDKTIRSLTNEVTGDNRVGRVSFIRDSSTLIVPTKVGHAQGLTRYL